MQPPIINYDQPLRDVLLEDFPDLGELPIKGGWGYTKEEAIIIDKNDPANTSRLFNGVRLEKIIAEKRIFEELIIFRSKGDKYMGIDWKLREQHVHREEDLAYDYLSFDVNAVHEKTGDRIEYLAEFWFEISSFY